MFTLLGLGVSTISYIIHECNKNELKKLNSFTIVTKNDNLKVGNYYFENVDILSRDKKNIYSCSKMIKKPIDDSNSYYIELMKKYDINKTIFYKSPLKEYNIVISNNNVFNCLDMSFKRLNEQIVDEGYVKSINKNGSLNVKYNKSLCYIQESSLPEIINCSFKGVVTNDTIFLKSFVNDFKSEHDKCKADVAFSKVLLSSSLLLLLGAFGIDVYNYHHRN